MQGAKTTSLTAQRHSRITVPVNSQRVNDARRCMAVRAFATGFDHKVQGAFCAGGLALLVAMTPAMGARAEVRLPPLDNDPQRCERGYTGNTIGQSNGVSGDKVLDLRFCDFTGADLSGKTLSGALLNDAILKGANLTEAVISKAFLVKANLQNANLSSSVLDRSTLDGADLRGATFVNAVITGITGFETANLEGADFTDALIGNEDAKRLCKNPTVANSEEMKEQIGCRGK
mmetsp:Transcript_14202/g.40527  ORF Transcript_14202/g.40527 Transcript_14202/m.40527 type:complete len:232 (-) Transcript_14202:1293-1988(-)